MRASEDGKFEMTTRISQVDKSVLLTVPNSNYEELIHKYSHLHVVVMDDNDKKSELPIHVILGVSEYSRIKTEKKPKIAADYQQLCSLDVSGLEAQTVKEVIS